MGSEMTATVAEGGGGSGTERTQRVQALEAGGTCAPAGRRRGRRGRRAPRAPVAPPPPARPPKLARGDALTFGHSLTELIGGQLDAGFVIDRFMEDWQPQPRFLIDRYLPTFLATRARRLG
ncbi:hypothetical protein G6F68_010565 [Rhizopus microsporus]|nr:hypothetical protein G6F68_010565 [Rhizopus microsporus]